MSIAGGLFAAGIALLLAAAFVASRPAPEDPRIIVLQDQIEDHRREAVAVRVTLGKLRDYLVRARSETR